MAKNIFVSKVLCFLLPFTAVALIALITNNCMYFIFDVNNSDCIFNIILFIFFLINVIIKQCY